MSLSENAAAERCVFVYGTLRRGQSNDIHRFSPAPLYVGDALIAGQLYDLGPYPGARLGGKGWIRGEVYAITRELEAQLDVLEEVSSVPTSEYARRSVVVNVDGRMLSCLVYEIALDRIAGCACVPSGDWTQR